MKVVQTNIIAIKLKKLGTIDLPEKKSTKKSTKKVASSSNTESKKKKRKRIIGDTNSKKSKQNKLAPDEQEVQQKIAETLEQLNVGHNKCRSY